VLDRNVRDSNLDGVQPLSDAGAAARRNLGLVEFLDLLGVFASGDLRRVLVAKPPSRFSRVLFELRIS
jgi:hypothetical protein